MSSQLYVKRYLFSCVNQLTKLQIAPLKCVLVIKSPSRTLLPPSALRHLLPAQSRRF